MKTKMKNGLDQSSHWEKNVHLRGKKNPQCSPMEDAARQWLKLLLTPSFQASSSHFSFLIMWLRMLPWLKNWEEFLQSALQAFYLLYTECMDCTILIYIRLPNDKKQCYSYLSSTAKEGFGSCRKEIWRPYEGQLWSKCISTVLRIWEDPKCLVVSLVQVIFLCHLESLNSEIAGTYV